MTHDFDQDPLLTIYNNPMDSTKWIKIVHPDNPQWYRLAHVNGYMEFMSTEEAISNGLEVLFNYRDLDH